jgi:D-aminopeptidase
MTAKPLKLTDPPEITFTMKNTADADIAELLPNIKRIDAYDLTYNCKDVMEAYKLMQIIANLSS